MLIRSDQGIAWKHDSEKDTTTPDDGYVLVGQDDGEEADAASNAAVEVELDGQGEEETIDKPTSNSSSSSRRDNKTKKRSETKKRSNKETRSDGTRRHRSSSSKHDKIKEHREHKHRRSSRDEQKKEHRSKEKHRDTNNNNSSYRYGSNICVLVLVVLAACVLLVPVIRQYHVKLQQLERQVQRLMEDNQQSNWNLRDELVEMHRKDQTHTQALMAQLQRDYDRLEKKLPLAMMEAFQEEIKAYFQKWKQVQSLLLQDNVERQLEQHDEIMDTKYHEWIKDHVDAQLQEQAIVWTEQFEHDLEHERDIRRRQFEHHARGNRELYQRVHDRNHKWRQEALQQLETTWSEQTIHNVTLQTQQYNKKLRHRVVRLEEHVEHAEEDKDELLELLQRMETHALTVEQEYSVSLHKHQEDLQELGLVLVELVDKVEQLDLTQQQQQEVPSTCGDKEQQQRVDEESAEHMSLDGSSLKNSVDKDTIKVLIRAALLERDRTGSEFLDITRFATVTLDPTVTWHTPPGIGKDGPARWFPMWDPLHAPHAVVSNFWPSHRNPSITIDLGHILSNIGRIRVVHTASDHDTDGRSKDIFYYGQSVLLSEDGETWETVYDTGDDYGPIETASEGHTIMLDQPRTARYIRHHCGRNNFHARVHFVAVQIGR